MKNPMNSSSSSSNGSLLALTSLNHISIVCRSVERSLDFYQKVLGFIPIRRPESLKFEGAWLFNYGIGIHLLQSEDPEGMAKKDEINPKDNHISFQCESMAAVEKQLTEMGIPFIQRTVEEGGISVDQLFFHDPDGFMIEVCNCEVLPVVPLAGGEAVWVCKRGASVVAANLVQPATPPPQQCVPAAAVHAKEETTSYPLYIE